MLRNLVPLAALFGMVKARYLECKTECPGVGAQISASVDRRNVCLKNSAFGNAHNPV